LKIDILYGYKVKPFLDLKSSYALYFIQSKNLHIQLFGKYLKQWKRLSTKTYYLH